MTSPSETLIQSVPNLEPQAQPEQTRQRLSGIVHDIGRNALSYLASNKVIRGALALGLAVCAGTVAGAVGEMIEPRPPVAAASTGGYPDWNKVCVAPGDPQAGQATGPAGTEWCAGYQWGDLIRNGEGQIIGNNQNSSRRYGYRNCTD